VTFQIAVDGVIGLALLGVASAVVFFFVRRRRPRYAWLLAPAVFALALTHLVPATGSPSPDLGLSMLIKLVTAIIVASTAAAMWVLAPRVLAVPTAAYLTGLNADLTTTVESRTTELVAANDRLTQALAENILVQQALACSEEQYRVSFEDAAVGKVQSDPESGVILRANRAFAHMLGYEPEDIIGQVGWSFTWPDEQAADRAEFARLVSGEIDAYIREKRYICKDGSPIWARISANVVSLPGSGRPKMTIGVVENIDERYKTQAALEVTRRDLEEMVVERTAALAQRDLLLQEVYHRVKNNLQVIDSILVLQARRLSDPAAKSAFSSLRKRVYALGLVHHQLMGSADLQTFDVAPFLLELTSNLVEGGAAGPVNLRVSAVPLNVGLDFAIPLGLLVTELVTNSLKHAFPTGKGNVEVALTRSDDGGLALVVSDDGAGYDCSEGAPGELSGGLGATIIKGLVHQLKATMNVRSANGTRSEVRMAKME